jgi:hypothetical protein
VPLGRYAAAGPALLLPFFFPGPPSSPFPFSPWPTLFLSTSSPPRPDWSLPAHLLGQGSLVQCHAYPIVCRHPHSIAPLMPAIRTTVRRADTVPAPWCTKIPPQRSDSFPPTAARVRSTNTRQNLTPNRNRGDLPIQANQGS